MNIVLIALLVLYVIAFLVLLWKSAAIWRWYQLLMAAVVMILAITFLAPLSGVLKTRAAWNKMFQTVESQLETEKATFRRLNEEEGGVNDLQLQLQNLSLESGRVWRQLQMTNVTPQGITLTKVPQQVPGLDPAMGAAAPADADQPVANAGPLIAESSIVYGFAEQTMQFNQTNWSVPVQYLGEFKVVSSTPTEVVVLTLNPPTPKQRALIEGGQAKIWSLYEVLPLDGHEPFMAEGSQPDDNNMFGRVDTELLQTLFGNRLSPETLDAYRKDGQRAAEGAVVVQDDAAAGDDAAAPSLQARNEQLTLWSKIKFTKPYTETVDSSEQREAKEGGFFEMGYAVDSRLKRIDGPEVKFSPGDEVFVAAEVATELRDEGVADILGNYNVRELNDYRFVLRRTDLRIDEVQDLIAELTKQKTVLEQTMAMTDAMNQKYQIDKSQLEADSEQIIKERDAIKAYTAKIQKEMDATKQQLTALYQSNLQLTNQLRKYHESTAEAVEQRSQAAAP
ncbi:hypothetical protein [Roseimaritima ulvae]|uniref:Uncharacterized protein n=1 Tax=Roseimaritima ulvae TaxID=980254 RepID=A0A5B9QWT1_9BACT|nr:hypothetical protein [Roseimaritima ulvae]QEG43504.1 hypothetical protein UC8_55540 [Roseimaritima ulvae]